MTVTVYSKPNCQPCRATKRTLDQLGVPYIEVDVSVDTEARDFVVSLGHLESPVVFIDEGRHWSGFRRDRLAELAA